MAWGGFGGKVKVQVGWAEESLAGFSRDFLLRGLGLSLTDVVVSGAPETGSEMKSPSSQLLTEGGDQVSNSDQVADSFEVIG